VDVIKLNICADRWHMPFPLLTKLGVTPAQIAYHEQRHAHAVFVEILLSHQAM